MIRQQQEKKNQFKIKCPKCGKYGIVRLKKIKIYKKINHHHHQHQRRLQEHLKPEFKTKKDFNGNVIEERINRTEHPYRYEGVMNYLFAPKVLLNSNKKPVINPPKPEPGPSKTADAIERAAKSFFLFADILASVEHKYPQIRSICKYFEEDLIKYLDMFGDLLNSAIDDRYKRSLPEWAMIVKEAVEKSPRAAAKKYSGITPDGKEVRLSVQSIRKKIPEVSEFFDTYPYYESIFIFIVTIVMKTVGQDPDLMAIYKKDYDAPIIEEEESGTIARETFKKVNEIMETLTNKADHFSDEDHAKMYYLIRDIRDIAKQNYEKQQNNYKLKLYEVFAIRHYDPEFRKKQKKERRLGIRNSKTCDGKSECMVEENDIQPEIVQKLRSKLVL